MSVAPDERLLTFVGEVQGMLDLDEFRSGVLGALARFVACDWVSLNAVGPGADRLGTLAEPEVPEELHDAWFEHAHENPLLARFLKTLDGRAYRFSDLMTADELHALDLYREFYAPLGIEYQVAFVLRAEPEVFVAIAMSRVTHDFTAAERVLLDRARPFIIQAYRNVIAHAGVVQALAARTDPQSALRDALLATGLTAREAQVISAVAVGADVASIAAGIGVGDRTVNKHLQNGYRKLGVHSRGGAAAVAWRLAAAAPEVTATPR